MDGSWLARCRSLILSVTRAAAGTRESEPAKRMFRRLDADVSCEGVGAGPLSAGLTRNPIARAEVLSVAPAGVVSACRRLAVSGPSDYMIGVSAFGCGRLNLLDVRGRSGLDGDRYGRRGETVLACARLESRGRSVGLR